MRNVIFVAPYPLETTYRFVRAAAALDGVRLLGVVAEPPRGEDARVFSDIATVSNPMDARALIEAGRRLQRRHGAIDRVVGILEPLQVQLAELRAALGAPGTSVDVADRFRDKGRMKDELRRAGLPCARHAVICSLGDALAFVEEVGFPIVIKPTAGMGCKSTWRVGDVRELHEAVAASRVSEHNPAIAEEFLRGREYSFETITVGGRVRFSSFSRYLPTPLEVMENPWIQWCVLHPREVTGPEYDDARELGERAVTALGLETGFTHMEWFRRDNGTLAIGEIAARPPGAQIVACNNFVHDADLHRAWARAVIDEAFDGPYERRHAVGAAFLRGMGQGRVAAVRGVGEAQELVRSLVVEARLPKVGAPKSDSYEGDGYVIVRHSDTNVVRSALKSIIDTIRVEYT